MLRRDIILLFSVVLLSFSGIVLAAMLGQLDMILSGWYSDPTATWTFPLPTVHWLSTSGGLLGINGAGVLISANDAWTSIYGYIVGSYLLAVFSAFILGHMMAGNTERSAKSGRADESD